jgi:hypothetical protein
VSLKETLLNDLKTAMKEKAEVKKNSIQMVRAALLQVEKDSKIILDDAGIIEVIAKQVKKIRDSLPIFEQSGRMDLVEGLNEEISCLMAYLPKQLTETELDDIVKKVINDIGATTQKELGKVMQATLPLVKGRADGNMVNQIAKKYLH